MKKIAYPDTGFSLLEMLMVLTIAGMLGYLSLSGWLRLQQMLQLETASRQLLQFLQQTQRVARWHNVALQISVQFSEEGEWQLQTRQDTRQVMPSFSLRDARMTLQAESASEQIWFFGHRGGASAGHFTLGNAAGEVRVIVSAKGRIRRCSVAGSVSGVAPC